MPTAPLLIFVVTEDWYFWSHRAALAQAALRAGYRVALAARFGAYRGRIADLGIECIEIPFERSLRHPRKDLAAMLALWRLIRKREPALVHTVALKPILLSVLSVLLNPRVRYVHAVTGMGYLFASADGVARLVQRLVRPALAFILRRRNAFAIVQNADDLALLGDLGVDTTRQASLIRGAGVDLTRFAATPLPRDEAPIVLLPARMLRDKGICEFLDAAKRVHAKFPTARFVLVGGLDPDNRAAFTREELEALVAEAGAEWWGGREDMPAVYRAATIVCLPSFYREGVPKSLLEGASSARPLVSTDTPGCRDVCIDGVTGVLVPPRDVPALAAALAGLLAAPARCAALGAGARARAESHFGAEAICSQTLDCYARLGVAPRAE